MSHDRGGGLTVEAHLSPRKANVPGTRADGRLLAWTLAVPRDVVEIEAAQTSCGTRAGGPAVIE
jgi:hypothetical protein